MSASSPCISICEVDNGRCIGCGRTETEIVEWRDYPESKRLAIMDRLEREAANGGWLAADAFDARPGAHAHAHASLSPSSSASPKPGRSQNPATDA